MTRSSTRHRILQNYHSK